MLPILFTSYRLKCCGLAQVRPWHTQNIKATRRDSHTKDTHIRFIPNPGFALGTSELWIHRTCTTPMHFLCVDVKISKMMNMLPIS